MPTSVSFGSEQLILVDEEDRVVGSASKLDAHNGDGTLHRAFSIFLFDQQDRILLQRRSLDKPLWPGYWSNTCCSHPRVGEDYQFATARRLREELGVTADLHRIYQFAYHATFSDVGAERELCTVFVGNIDLPATVDVHPEEIMDWGWFTAQEITDWIAAEPDAFTPWFKMEWETLTVDHWSSVRRNVA